MKPVFFIWFGMCLFILTGCVSNPPTENGTTSFFTTPTSMSQISGAYVNKTVEVRGLTLLYNNQFVGTNAFAGNVPFRWALQDEQGYRLLINPLPEPNRKLYSDTNISITGVIKELCNCENSIPPSYSPLANCSINKNENTITFSYYDATNLTELVQFLAMLDDNYAPLPPGFTLPEGYPVPEPKGQTICNKTISGNAANYTCEVSLGNHQYFCGIDIERPIYYISDEKINSEQCLSMSNETETFRCKDGTVSYYLNATQPYTVLQ